MNVTIKDEMMSELTNEMVAGVSGGLGAFLIGYFAGKALDYGSDALVEHGQQFSERDHSASNAYFLENRHKFNSTI